jgi:hypothetical protein
VPGAIAVTTYQVAIGFVAATLRTLWPYELSRLLVTIQQGRTTLLIQKPDCERRYRGT